MLVELFICISYHSLTDVNFQGRWWTKQLATLDRIWYIIIMHVSIWTCDEVAASCSKYSSVVGRKIQRRASRNCRNCLKRFSRVTLRCSVLLPVLQPLLHVLLHPMLLAMEFLVPATKEIHRKWAQAIWRWEALNLKDFVLGYVLCLFLCASHDSLKHV